MIDLRRRLKEVEMSHKVFERKERRDFKARYNDDVRPQLMQVKKVCSKRTKSRCEKPEKISDFAVWYGNLRCKEEEKSEKSLKQEERDDKKEVDVLRNVAVSFYDDLMDADITTRYPANGERYDFVTLVAAIYQANMELGYRTSDNQTTYTEPEVFEYTLQKISNTDMRKRAEVYREKIKKQLQKKAKAMTDT